MMPIGVVARQTGVEVGTLRKWEHRYGFPKPGRSASGQRTYSDADVEALRRIVVRMAGGERIGKLVRESADELPAQAPGSPAALRPDVQAALDALSRTDIPHLRLLLDRARNARSLLGFVDDFATPLLEEVGNCWARGDLPVHGEHLCSSLLESLLSRDAGMATVPRQQTVLLTTLAGEKHRLSLYMLDAILSQAGIACVRLDGDLPVAEIAAAAKAYRVSAVGISASSHYPPRLLHRSVEQLRATLPRHAELWLGGAGMKTLRRIPAQTEVFLSIRQLLEKCAARPQSRASSRGVREHRP